MVSRWGVRVVVMGRSVGTAMLFVFMALVRTYWGPSSVHLEHDTLLMFFEKEPGAHGSHSSDPAKRLYLPFGQSSHDVDVLRAWNLPASEGWWRGLLLAGGGDVGFRNQASMRPVPTTRGDIRGSPTYRT